MNIRQAVASAFAVACLAVPTALCADKPLAAQSGKSPTVAASSQQPVIIKGIELPKQPTVPTGSADVKVCGSVGAFGANAKGCIGTDGASVGVSAGTGVSAGASGKVGWDGKKTTCETVAATVPIPVGAPLVGTGARSYCRDGEGHTSTKDSFGGGVGVGTEGYKAAVTVELTPTGETKPLLFPYQTRGTRTDIGQTELKNITIQTGNKNSASAITTSPGKATDKSK